VLAQAFYTNISTETQIKHTTRA